MSAHDDDPLIDNIRVGQDAVIEFSVRNTGDDSVRDYTGASVSVAFTDGRGNVLWGPTAGALDADPATEPQCKVTIDATDTQLLPPQMVKVRATVTLLGGTIDVVQCHFRLID